MPTPPEQQQDAALKWIAERWTKWGERCQMCGEDNWAVGPLLGIPVRSKIGMLDLSQRVFPTFPITCTTCGNTHFLSAIAAQIIPRAEGPES